MSNTAEINKSVASVGYFWDALEESGRFELFPVYGTSKYNFRWAIHKQTGMQGMIWFSAYQGDFKRRQGLVVRLSFDNHLYAGYKIPTKSQVIAATYPQPPEQPHGFSTQEKSFLPEESSWAISQLHRSLMDSSIAPYDWTAEAKLVSKWISRNGKYVPLMPKTEAQKEAGGSSAFELLTTTDLDSLCKTHKEFADRLFDLWHGPVSKRQAEDYASARKDAPLTWGLMDSYSPHLKKMRQETLGMRAKVENDEASWSQLMFGQDGFKDRLQEIVGIAAVHPALRSSRAYDFACDYFLKKTGYK